jgi:ketosteroid isomerase-like protein
MRQRDKVVDFFTCVNERDLAGFENLLREDAVFYFPKTRPLLSRERIIRFFRVLFRQYPRLSFQIQRIIMEGNLAAVHWSNCGINRGHEPYENEGVTLLELAGDRVRYISDFFKDTEKF